MEEIPVYISKSLLDSAYVLQYPTKNSGTSLENQEIVNCCIKPISQQIKIDFRLDTASKNYDASKGEELAWKADGKNPNRAQERPTFQNGIMDKQSFVSCLPMKNVDRYIVGILQDREVHASQIQNIIQMRPSYTCFDKLDKRNKAEQKADNDADDADEEIKQVTVKFSRIENERIKKAREKSFNVISQRGAEEPWCEAMWHAKDSTASELEKQKLFATNNEASGHALSLSNREYFDNLVSIEEKVISVTDGIPNCVISRELLLNMSLLDQLKVILRDAKVLDYNSIVKLVGDKNVTGEKLVRTLPLAGILVRGNWVVQSEFLYPPKSVSSVNGVSAELMCRGRDYILYKFAKCDEIDRRQVAAIVLLPPEEVLEILKSVGRLNAQRKWEFMCASDPAFEAKHQELVQRQEVYWRAKEEKFNELEANKSPKRVRKKSVRESKTSESK